MAKIAFIGLGAMGSRMARNLTTGTHELWVHNRTRERADELLERGAIWADSPREAAANAEFVITMVTDDEAARAVWLAPKTGAIHGLADSALAIESSTVSPTWVRELDASLKTNGNRLVDAPVAGTRPQAEASVLAYLVGGDLNDVERARPIFEALGKVVLHAGPVGMGAVLKLAVNALLGTQVAVMGELLGLMSREGIAVPRAVELLSALPVTSPALAGLSGLIAEGEFAPMFPVDLVSKDIGYAHAAAGSSTPTPVLAGVAAAFESAVAAGFGAENIQAVAKLSLG